jgi:D-tyrosyl-tRNA(Tyr) deacylase
VRAVIQRVTCASVVVDGSPVAAIGRGLLVLLAVEQGDTEREALALAAKIAKLRIFPDERKPMNLDIAAIDGEALVVSQFTLAGDVSRGNRPSFANAADPELAERLYLRVADELREAGVPTQTGVFGAHMDVALLNDGPVTFTLSARDGSLPR